MSRALIIAFAVALSGLIACAGPSPSPSHEPIRTLRKTADVPAACESLDLFIAADAVRLPGHPCRAWVEMIRGRVFATGVAMSGTVVSTAAARGGGVFLTCVHCVGASSQVLTDPESKPPPVLMVREGDGFYFAHRMFAPIPPASALDTSGHLTKILPRDDVVVATISNKRFAAKGAYPLAPPQVKDGAIALDDPRGIASSDKPWTEPAPGAQVLLLGYPRDLPDRAFGGALVGSVGKVLDDASARDKLSRAEADEASIPYDRDVEVVIATRTVSGMSGGGAFDADGRFLGVLVRGTEHSVDGTYLTRVVRASFIFAQLRAALGQADAALRDRITPFLPPL